ncbi:hypothetical protein KUTeg_000299 [Tegillarca granosa]|uniref:tRNA (guanine(10)-N(2))-methyltransferase TRMT11 N-terminal domain-containing protein n=1 Tax=Tegillarca granosa TaxID=220873 RepID=A0ABQ9FX57_TEGGR|nr:hypothetical protein KUTeg_000299 [Tegillarca granosa]
MTSYGGNLKCLQTGNSRVKNNFVPLVFPVFQPSFLARYQLQHFAKKFLFSIYQDVTVINDKYSVKAIPGKRNYGYMTAMELFQANKIMVIKKKKQHKAATMVVLILKKPLIECSELVNIKAYLEQEFHSIASLFGIKYTFEDCGLGYNNPLAFTTPFLIVNLKSEDDAKKITSRSILTNHVDGKESDVTRDPKVEKDISIRAMGTWSNLQRSVQKCQGLSFRTQGMVAQYDIKYQKLSFRTQGMVAQYDIKYQKLSFRTQGMVAQYDIKYQKLSFRIN